MKTTLLIIIVLLLTASCTKTSASPFAGTSWTLRGMGYEDDVIEISTSRPITLKFQAEDAKLSGHTGCNSYSGQYRTKGSTFHAIGITATERNCATTTLFQRETTYRTALTNAESATLTQYGRWLVIKTTNGEVLIFAP